MNDFKDYLLDCLEYWSDKYSPNEFSKLVENKTGIQLLNCRYEDGYYYGTIKSELSIKCSFWAIQDFFLDGTTWDIEDLFDNNLNELQEQYNKMDENEFNAHIYKIFTKYLITGIPQYGTPLDCEGSYISINIDEKNWMPDKINTILNIFSKFNYIESNYIKINDGYLDINCRDITKNKLIEFLINNNWLDINNCFDKDTVSMIYENTLNTYIDDFVQELFSNKELQEDFSNQINNTLLTMLKNNEIEIEK